MNEDGLEEFALYASQEYGWDFPEVNSWEELIENWPELEMHTQSDFIDMMAEAGISKEDILYVLENTAVADLEMG